MRICARPIRIGIMVFGAGVVLAEPIEAAGVRCAIHTGNGTGFSEKIAQFQAQEGLLQDTDMALWAAWMATGSTPGYKLGHTKYRCQKETGLGVTCQGKARICKL